jgi:hypothetical protein
MPTTVKDAIKKFETTNECVAAEAEKVRNTLAFRVTRGVHARGNLKLHVCFHSNSRIIHSV